MAVVSIKNKLRRGNLLVGNDPFIPNSYESIATVTVGAGGASSVDFTSIPSTYTHLQIRGLGVFSGDTFLQFNSDTNNNYSRHSVYGDGSSAAAFAETSNSRIGVNYATSTQPSPFVADILDYKDTNKYKTVRALSGVDSNGSGIILLQSGSWRSTSAVTSIKLIAFSGTFSQHSTFALYGIKSA